MAYHLATTSRKAIHDTRQKRILLTWHAPGRTWPSHPQHLHQGIHHLACSTGASFRLIVSWPPNLRWSPHSCINVTHHMFQFAPRPKVGSKHQAHTRFFLWTIFRYTSHDNNLFLPFLLFLLHLIVSLCSTYCISLRSFFFSRHCGAYLLLRCLSYRRITKLVLHCWESRIETPYTTVYILTVV